MLTPPEGPLLVEDMADRIEHEDLHVEDAYERYGAPAVLDAAAMLVEDLFGLIDTSEGLTKIAEENLVLAKGALEGAAQAEREHAEKA